MYTSRSKSSAIPSRSAAACTTRAGDIVQKHLQVGSPTDVAEKEADAVADKVMRMPERSFLQRKCAECEEEDKVRKKPLATPNTPKIQAKAESGGTVSENVSKGIAGSKNSGQSLDNHTRSFMESRFGTDFSHVNIHTGTEAVQMSRELQAKAFTVGNNIYFNDGQYNPSSTEGRHLLAHELTHTIQQGSVRSKATGDANGIQRQAAPAPRRTIWLNIGFDSSAQANDVTMRRLRASVAAERAALLSCCTGHNLGCNIDLRVHYDWVRHNKPAPADGDYDNDVAEDRTLRDSNLDRIDAPNGGLRVLVTESTLSQTWQGARIFPRANTGARGVLWNRSLAADDTLAHEAGHAAGYTGNFEGGSHHSDPDNLMSPGSIRHAGATPDTNWCQQMIATAV